jgi:16S rRNA processing protein RimM
LTGEPGEPGTPAPEDAGGLAAGRVGRAHGLDGSFYVTRPRPRLLRVGVGVAIAGRNTTIVRLAGTEQRPIVRVEGVESRLAAEALRGEDITVRDADAPVLGDGEWWAHELQGCAVVDGDALLGTVSRLLELPSCEVLEVDAADGGEAVLVPMVRDAIRRIEPANGRIEVSLEFLDVADRALTVAERRAPASSPEDAAERNAPDASAKDAGEASAGS